MVCESNITQRLYGELEKSQQRIVELRELRIAPEPDGGQSGTDNPITTQIRKLSAR